ncbi:MAG: hypothetical protein ACK521_01370, partial [bacterium]
MDLPEEEYNLTLRNFLNNVSNKGFDMFYKDWSKANYQRNIQGFNWLSKYEQKDVARMDHSREVDPSIYAFGITGMVNSAAAGAIWSYFLNDSIKVNKYFFYWYAWFSAFLIHTIFWGLIVVLWPLSYIGDLNTLTFIDIWMEVIKYGGVYGGYEVILILLIVGVLVNYDGGWAFSTLVSWSVVAGYLLLAGGSGF